MDRINLLNNGEKAVAGGGLLMLIAGLFLPWWRFSISGLGSATEGGFGQPGSIWSILAVLISIVLAGTIVAVKFGNVQMPALPSDLSWGQLYGGGGALVVVFMLLKAWRIGAVPIGGFGLGFFVAVVATAAIAYGGYLLCTEEKGRAGSG